MGSGLGCWALAGYETHNAAGPLQPMLSSQNEKPVFKFPAGQVTCHLMETVMTDADGVNISFPVAELAP